MGAVGRIYLDHAATAPLRPEVAAVMTSWWARGPGNASSLHHEGLSARMALDEARERVSHAVGCDFAEVCFTGSGTEAVNLALLGHALSADRDPSRRRVLMSAAEHHAVLHVRPVLELLGLEVTLLPVDGEARVDLDALSAMLDEEVAMVAVMAANNEVGTVQPVEQVAARVHAVGAWLLVDAVQTFARESTPAWAKGADLVAASAHKIGGPQGVGILAVRAGVPLEAVMRGGGQERERRAGTEDVAGVVGAGLATALTHQHWREERAETEVARDAFEAVARDRLGPRWVPTLAPDTVRLPSHAHFRVPGVTAETLLIRLDREGVAASAGAACSSGSVEPSHVVMAMGRSEGAARESVRFTFGPTTGVDEAREAAARLARCVQAIDAARGG